MRGNMRISIAVTTTIFVFALVLTYSPAATAVADTISSQAGSLGFTQDEGNIQTDEPEGGTFVPQADAVPNRADVFATPSVWPNYPEPQTWGACGAFREKYRLKVIRSFKRVRGDDPRRHLAAGTSNLACGSDQWGYYHISAPRSEKGHLEDWDNVASYTNQNWRDVADVFINIALSDPDSVTYKQKNDTFEYCRIAYLVNLRTGQVVDETYPRVIISVRTSNIITAYPDSDLCPTKPVPPCQPHKPC
jgi:hypothetical protein